MKLLHKASHLEVQLADRDVDDGNVREQVSQHFDLVLGQEKQHLQVFLPLPDLVAIRAGCEYPPP